jgi:UDP-perosamine 4-acetyltransferase
MDDLLAAKNGFLNTRSLPAVVGLGAGGHAKVVIEILRAAGQYTVCGLLDRDPRLQGKQVLDVAVLGTDDLLTFLREAGVEHGFVGVGTTETAATRVRLYRQAVQAGLKVVSAIHPAAVVSPSARLGAGATIAAGAIINAEAELGENVIVNTGAIVEHDCVVADHAHVASGVRLAGGVRVGAAAVIGVGACVRPGVRIGEGSLVGAGAVVVRDLSDHVVAMGVPARVARRLSEG